MPRPIILASGSEIRADLLRNANVVFDVKVARIDEEMIRRSLQAEEASPRDIADALAEMKARRVSDQNPDALVIGCDQVLDFEGEVFGKPETEDQARDQLLQLRGKRHALLSAVVMYQGGQPVWRHVGQVRLQMSDFSDRYLRDYLTRNWQSIRHSVGGYKLEEEGIRLFSKVEGDYFTVLGLPLIEVLTYLTAKGELDR